MADYRTFARYGQSKVANMLFASELARRHTGITSVSCHPGVINTKQTTSYRSINGLKGLAFGALVVLIRKSLSEGGKNQLWCAMGKGVVSGRYYLPVRAVHAGNGFPDDKVLGKQLWDWTEDELSKKGYV